MSQVKTFTASFTRPADTTAYASGDLVVNNVTAGSVVPLSFVNDVLVGHVFLRRVRIHKSGTSITNASFRLHLFSAAPVFAAGDNAALSVTGVDKYLGAFDVTMSQAYTDGAVGVGVPVTGSEISVEELQSRTALYGFLEAKGAYIPTSGETFTIRLEGHRY